MHSYNLVVYKQPVHCINCHLEPFFIVAVNYLPGYVLVNHIVFIDIKQFDSGYYVGVFA